MFTHILLLVLFAKGVSLASPIFQCDFETDTCGFVQVPKGYGSSRDYDDWSRHKGSPPKRYKNGPTRDHTKSSGYYFYYYVTAHGSFGTSAKIYKQIAIPNQDNIWLRFYYMMYSQQVMGLMGDLTVHLDGTSIFSKSRNQGDKWHKAEIKLTKSGNLKLQFGATKYKDPYGNVAIDDVTVAEYYKANATNLTAANTDVCLNANIDLDCKLANGFPEPDQCTFYKNESQQWSQPACKLVQKSTVVGTHTYRCLPTNVLGDAPNKTISIVTHDLPKFTDPIPANIEIIEGKTLTIFANVTGNGPFQYTWKRKYSNIVFPDQSNLTVEGITSGGRYSVVVTDKNGCTVSSGECNVKLQYAPKTCSISQSYTPIRTCLKGRVYLYCYASAYPSVNQYMFMADGKVLQASSNRRLDIKSSLVGEYVYTCKPSNVIGAVAKNCTRTVFTKAPPNITWSSSNITTVEGSRVLIRCNITGSEPMTVSWTKIGAGAVPGNTSTLTLDNVKTANNGAYECTAANGNECPAAKSTPTFLHVVYKPRHTNLTVSNSSLCLNDHLSFECSAIGDPPVDEYLFYVNDQMLETSKTGKLQINTTIVGNNAYTCQPRNSVGLGENATMFVNTKAPPNVTWISPKQSIAEPFKASFFCNVTGSEPMKVEWRKAGSVAVLANGTNFTIGSILRSQEGTYEVTASNGHECPIKQSSAYVDVLYEPEIKTSFKNSLTLKEKFQVQLICTTDGDPTPNITWSRGNIIVGSDENLVLPAEQSEPGIYTCTARNGIGREKKASTNVIVNVCDNVCKNNATCVPKGTTFECNCTEGFRARYCQTVDRKADKFEIKFVVTSLVWKDDYEDSSSIVFTTLQKDICDQLRKLFFNLLTCTVIRAWQGSVVAHTKLTFNETRSESEVVNALLKATANGSLGTLKLNTTAGFSIAAQDDPCAGKPCNFGGKCVAEDGEYTCDCKLFRFGSHCEKGLGLVAGIIVIVAGFVALIIIVYAIYRCCKWSSSNNNAYSTKKSSASFSTTVDGPEDNKGSYPATAIKMDNYRVKDGHGDENRYENVRRKSSVENKYEQIQEPVENVYDNPVYEDMNQNEKEVDGSIAL